VTASRPRLLLDARKARDYGIGRYILGLLGALARRGDLDLVAVVRRADRALLPTAVSPEFCDAAHYSVSEPMAVRAAIGRVRPDIFHAPHYVLPFFPPAATVVTVHDLMHLSRPEHASPAKRAYARWMLGRVVRRAARIIVVSRATAGELAAFDGRSAAKTVVIPDGVGERFLAAIPAGERSRVRGAHGLGEAPYILFLGNDKPHKNLSGLLDAFSHVRRRGLPHGLVLAGGSPGPAAARRREAIAVRGLSDAVRDLGVVPDGDVPPLVAEATALVLPSFSEGFGIPVLEAQAAGTPVICSDRGGLPEAAGGAALFIDPDRPESITEALERLLRDARLRDTLSADGRKHAEGFTWDDVGARTLRVYEEILARPSRT